jgi:HEAT repeat protein
VHPRLHAALLLGTLVIAGCSSAASTDDLIGDLSSTDEEDRKNAVRLLADRKGDASKVVPALTQSLKDEHADIRRSAAIGLGYFGKEAALAMPELEALKEDPDARVREAAGVALSRIRK